MQLRLEMQAFVSESQREAELEERRRYRFLAEKHQMLYSTLLQFYSRVWLWHADEQADRREPGLSSPLGEGSICAETGQEVMNFLLWGSS